MAKQILHSRIKLSRLKILICIMVSLIQNATTFVDSERIILIRPIPQTSNTSFWQLHFFRIELTSADNSTKLKLNAIVPFLLLQTNSRLFFSKVLVNLPLLYLASRQKSSEIFNISRQKFKIKILTCNISNLFQQNLT